MKVRKRFRNRGSNNMVSLKDIASACGVSTATVSKALNGQADVGEDTRERIKKKAQEMGYLPNVAARMLKTNRSHNIGVLYSDDAGTGLTHEYFSGVLNGFKDGAEALGYDITFINTGLRDHRTYLEHCRYRNFDGVAIVCANYNEPDVQELMNSDLPVVTIDYVHQNCTAVSSNNVQGMTALMEYIVEKGHKEIAYIHGQDYSYVTKERLAAFYRVMESHNLPVREEFLMEAVYLDAKSVAQCTRTLLGMRHRPTCIVYPDDVSLVGGFNVINEAGLSIPHDISIAGYDGSLISQLIRPKLTTIQQDTDQIGKEAAKRLICFLEQPKTTLQERVVVEGILLEGQSVGFPPRKE